MTRNPTPTVLEMGQLHFSGNVTPHTWYQHLVKTVRRKSARHKTAEKTAPYLEAIIILSDICYWYRPQQVRDEQTGAVIELRRRFQSDKLQRSYQQLADSFGFGKGQARAAVRWLEKRGLITVELRDIAMRGVPLQNVMYLEPIVEAIAALNMPIEGVSDVHKTPPPIDIKDPPPCTSDTYTETSAGISAETSLKEPPVADSPPADTFKIVDADGMTTVVVHLDSPVEDSPPLEKSLAINAEWNERHYPPRDIDGTPLSKELLESWAKIDEDHPEWAGIDVTEDPATHWPDVPAGPPQDGTDVAFDIAETPETVAFWPEGETPPQPSSQEAPEQRVARLRDELGTDPLGVASVVVQNRAGVAHPDGGDASKDGDAWIDLPVMEWCAFIRIPYDGQSLSRKAMWARDLRKLATGDGLGKTPRLTGEAIRIMTLSPSCEWLRTAGRPTHNGFAETLINVLCGQALPEGKPNGGASGGRNDAPQVDQAVAETMARLFDENGVRIRRE